MEKMILQCAPLPESKEISTFDFPTASTIGDIIKKQRLKTGMTQAALAHATGLTTAEISRLEANITMKPSKEKIIKLAAYTGLGYSCLLMCAGYSGIYDKEIYYNKQAHPIPYEDIVADIYQADSELLELLLGINQLPIEDISLLKDFIYLLKITHTDNKSHINLPKFILSLFESIKHFLVEQFSIILNVVTPSINRS